MLFQLTSVFESSHFTKTLKIVGAYSGLWFFVGVLQHALFPFFIFTSTTYIGMLKYLRELSHMGLQRHLKNDANVPIEVISSRLSTDYNSLLGEGFFGKVYKGTLSCRNNFEKLIISVAVKSMEYDSSQFEFFCSELKASVIMRGHENVVRFYGVNFVKTGEKVPMANLVFEYCEKGSLKSFLENIRKSLSTGKNDCRDTMIEHQLLNWTFQIAKGMQFISSQNIIHGDLAARNILLNSSLVAKISDFGMSKILYTNQKYATSLQAAFPWRWMAPESLTELKFSIQSDVWSYGVLLWEIFSLGIQPWTGQMWTSDFANMLKSGKRLEKPSFVSDDVYESIICGCWALDANSRIKFSEIVLYFENCCKILAFDSEIQTTSV